MTGRRLDDELPGDRTSSVRRRRWGLVALSALALLALWDAALRPPERQVSNRLLLTAIEAYRDHLSTAVARAGVVCRFEPSCSRYAVAVLRRHGALEGGSSAVWRLLRCGPWTPPGTRDPPPGAGSGSTALD